MSHEPSRANREAEHASRKPAASTAERASEPSTGGAGLQGRIGNRSLARLLKAQQPPPPVALTADGETRLSAAAATHPRRDEIRAHEAVHRLQFQSRRPRGTRTELETDAGRGSEALLRGHPYTPRVSAPPGSVLLYGEGAEAWFPDIDAQGQREQEALQREGLTHPESRIEVGFGTHDDYRTGGARARYESAVSASGDIGSIHSTTAVTLHYEPDRTVSVVGPPMVRIDPERGLGPSDERPAYPYVLSYSRTIEYSDRQGRTATVEVDGHVFLSEYTVWARLGGIQNPSFEALLTLLGDSGYITTSLRGSGPITGYYASYAAPGNSLDIQASGAATGLGHRGGLSLIDVSVPATFVDPRLTAGSQYESLRAFLLSADAAELARRAAVSTITSEPGWLDRLTQSLADLVGGALTPVIKALDSVTEAISEWWNELPAWTRGILTAVAKFAVALGLMAAAAGLIVLATKGAIAFGLAMLIVGAVALAAAYVMSFVSRFAEAWQSDNRLRLLLVPTMAVLDAIGLSMIIEAVTDKSLLTGQELRRSEEEQWEAGTTGVLQVVGIFLMVRGLRGGPSGRVVTPEVRGRMADFHALPAERLPRLPEGHYWVRQGPEWVLYREPGAPEVPLEISIYSDGQGNINYNVRSGSRVLQSEARTRPSDDTFPRGEENRLPPEIRATGEENPYIEEGTGQLFERGHGVDYADRIAGPGVRSSNADIANFTPQARFWNSFLRNHLVGRIRRAGGGYREMPLYEGPPRATVDGTPIPSDFVFVETNPAGQALSAWRIPNDTGITTRTMSELPRYEIPLEEIPSVMIESTGKMRPPGAPAGPAGVIITGTRGDEELPE